MKTVDITFESLHKDPGESPLVITMKSTDDFIDHTIDEMLAGGYTFIGRKVVPWWKIFVRNPFNTFILGMIFDAILLGIFTVITWKVDH